MKINVLVLGSGGREHALAWAIARSPHCGKLYSAPGNPGIAELAELLPLSLTDCDGIVRSVKTLDIGLTVVGPEGPLASGIVDRFNEEGLAIFGPTRAASELEWSKVFAKEFMARHEIPTAPYRVFAPNEEDAAQEYVRHHNPPFVVKADGLAAGKGVVVCATRAEGSAVIRDFMKARTLGDAGSQLVLEGFLDGEEASVFAVTDGEQYTLLAAAQDHKRALDGDQGKNTGGMGAYAPAPCVTPAILSRVEQDILLPVLRGMKQEGRTYRGCLYLGLMLTSSGPQVIEFNARFGDPETQVVLPLFQGDLLMLLLESAKGHLSSETLSESARSVGRAAVCVVLASGGYPGSYASGLPIDGLSDLAGLQGILTFHAGTAAKGGQIETSGGRVLGVTAVDEGGDLARAITSAYAAVGHVTFRGMHFRHDIGARALRWLH
jgi:phosphoribosylamine--glycine ligase